MTNPKRIFVLVHPYGLEQRVLESFAEDTLRQMKQKGIRITGSEQKRLYKRMLKKGEEARGEVLSQMELSDITYILPAYREKLPAFVEKHVKDNKFLEKRLKEVYSTVSLSAGGKRKKPSEESRQELYHALIRFLAESTGGTREDAERVIDRLTPEHYEKNKEALGRILSSEKSPEYIDRQLHGLSYALGIDRITQDSKIIVGGSSYPVCVRQTTEWLRTLKYNPVVREEATDFYVLKELADYVSRSVRKKQH